MRRHRYHSTLSTISLAFAAVAIILLGYSLGIGDAETKTAFQSRLNEPLIRGSAAESIVSIPYLHRNKNISDPILTASSSLVWDSASSTTLWSYNASEQRPIASITKLITATVVIDSVDLDKEVIISQSAVSTQGNAGDLQVGETLNIVTLLQAMLIESSNDAAVALAEYVEAQTSLDFKELMNARTRTMGLTHSQFQDPAGLVDEGAYSTAHDLATLLDVLRTSEHYELIWNILKKPGSTAFSQNGEVVHTFENTNPFVAELGGVLGGKTGYTTGAGESMVLVANAPDSSREIYYIVLGSSDRFTDIRTLINWVASAYIWEQRQ